MYSSSCFLPSILPFCLHLIQICLLLTGAFGVFFLAASASTLSILILIHCAAIFGPLDQNIKENSFYNPY